MLVPDGKWTSADGPIRLVTSAWTSTTREDCELVAFAGTVLKYVEKFADEFDLPAFRTYTDHESLLAEVNPDILRICTPTLTHSELTIDCITTGVDAIYYKKLIAKT